MTFCEASFEFIWLDSRKYLKRYQQFLRNKFIVLGRGQSQPALSLKVPRVNLTVAQSEFVQRNGVLSFVFLRKQCDLKSYLNAYLCKKWCSGIES